MAQLVEVTADLERIRLEIADAERLLRDGHPEVEGLLLALFDWRFERGILERELLA